MRKFFFNLIFYFLLCFSSAYAATVSDYPGGSVAGGIAESRHNLGSLGQFSKFENKTEICIVCHTPHHSNTSVSPAPLWNRYNGTNSYTAYGATLGGSAVNQVGSVSLACLSCHDGVTSFDNIVSGGWNCDVTYLKRWEEIPGTGISVYRRRKVIRCGNPDTKWWFYYDYNTLDLLVSPDMANIGTGTGTGTTEGYTIDIVNPSLNIGTDLTNDHPVSINYNPDVAGLRPVNTRISSINLTSGLQGSASEAYNGNLTQNRWAIRGFIDNGTATISDLLRNGKVECSSCHDPHFSNKSFDEVDGKGYYAGLPEWQMDGLFLRRIGGNTGSAICRTCHNK